METTSLLILVLSLSSTTVHSLTDNDFYIDANGNLIADGSEHDLPVSISNLRNSTKTAAKYSFTVGVLVLLTSDSNNSIGINLQDPNRDKTGLAGVVVSTDPELIKRALKDITDKYKEVDPTAVTPTHLLLFNNIAVQALSLSPSTGVSTYQFVLATNGQYTYSIILFVSVDPGASSENIGIGSYDLPYSSNITNAAMESNTGVPGKYVVDMNETPPPCYCKRRVLAMACQIRKQRSGDLPVLCQDFQQTESNNNN